MGSFLQRPVEEVVVGTEIADPLNEGPQRREVSATFGSTSRDSTGIGLNLGSDATADLFWPDGE